MSDTVLKPEEATAMSDDELLAAAWVESAQSNTQAEERSAGFLFPAEFIGALADTANEALTNWLKANNAPAEAVRLVDEIVYLTRAEYDIELGNMNSHTADSLLDIVPEVTDSIVKLGGEFIGGGSVFRGEPIKWEPKQVGF